MSLSIRLHSAAPPEEVLEAIRRDAREWRESAVPQALRDRGMRRLAVKFSGSGFALYMQTISDPGDELVLHGRVLPGDAGGSLVLVECGPPDGLRSHPAWFAAPGAILLLTGEYAPGVVLLGIAAAGVLLAGFGERRVVCGGDDVTRYLLARLESALAPLDDVAGKR